MDGSLHALPSKPAWPRAMADVRTLAPGLLALAFLLLQIGAQWLGFLVLAVGPTGRQH